MAQSDKGGAAADKGKLQLIEGALYAAGRPLDLDTLASVVKLRSRDRVKEMARLVAERYRQGATSLEVLELQDGRFVMQLKPEFVGAVKKLATRRLLTLGPMKTLSFIAFKQPVTQSYVVKVRGKLAYGHVKQLRDLQLISESKLGRTKVLRTTETFADYFDLSHEVRLMKRQLERLFKDLSLVRDGEKKGS